MTDHRGWLRARRPDPPEPVRDAVLKAVEQFDAGGVGVPERLARTGLAVLADLVAGPSRREHAAELLAADALLTYACEAAAEEGGDALDAVLTLLRPASFEALLDGEVVEE